MEKNSKTGLSSTIRVGLCWQTMSKRMRAPTYQVCENSYVVTDQPATSVVLSARWFSRLAMPLESFFNLYDLDDGSSYCVLPSCQLRPVRVDQALWFWRPLILSANLVPGTLSRREFFIPNSSIQRQKSSTNLESCQEQDYFHHLYRFLSRLSELKKKTPPLLMRR